MRATHSCNVFSQNCHYNKKEWNVFSHKVKETMYNIQSSLQGLKVNKI